MRKRERSLLRIALNAVRSARSTRLALRRTLALVAILFVVTESPSLALDPTSRISQYGHSVWRVQDGDFGGAVYVIAQSVDGYIWVGTETGLYRFDGVRFALWSSPSGDELPSPTVLALLGARDGSLWIGTAAGLAHLVNNRLIQYETNQGWQVSAIFEDKDGGIWINHFRADDKVHSLCQVLGSGLRCYGSKEGIDVVGATAIAQDNSGNFWVGGETTLVKWHAGASKVYRPQALRDNEHSAGILEIAPESDGSVLVGVDTPMPGGGLQRMANGVLQPFVVPKLNGETLAVAALKRDRQNNLWVGTWNNGLFRIHGTKVDHFGDAEGLSNNSVEHIFEDREGDVWVVTLQGLDMFRDLAVKTISTREGLKYSGASSIAAWRDGSVVIGTERLQLLGPDGVLLDLGKELPGDAATALFVDHAGRLWAGMLNKLFVYENGKFHEITKGDGGALGMAMGITEDSTHNIWVETAGQPGTLLQIRDLKVQKEFPTPLVPLARKIVADPNGGIWLGLVTGDLALYRNGQINIVGFGDHQRSRVVAITATPDGAILGATGFGLVAWKGGRKQLLSRRNGLPCDAVNGVISDNVGGLWLNTTCGLVKVPKDQLQLWWEHPESTLKLRVFDAFDGVQPGLGLFNNSAKTPDGRLWFANGAVVQVIDPAHMAENTVPPPVDISAVVADRKAYAPRSVVRLPPLARDLEIDYAALSYAAPQKVQFRYMLEGRDNGWQDPGTRREAFYTDLNPGRYRFRVIACNNDGVWNQTGAFLDFSIAPAYYQTTWFRLCCAAALLLLLWAAYQFRIKQLETRFAVGLEARVNERTRIARELHDTLLQSFNALVVRLQTVSNVLPVQPEEAKRRIDRAIEQASNAVTEGRDKVHELRSGGSGATDLHQSLSDYAKELLSGSTSEPLSTVHVRVEGTPVALNPVVRDEAYRIAAEGLRNAIRHAHARRIEVEIRYDERQLRLRIRDDGSGIDPAILESEHRAGHWGLRGMRERAKLVGGTLELWSQVETGTEVELIIPAASAYVRSPSSIWSAFSRLRRV